MPGTSGTSPGPTKLRMARPNWVTGISSAYELPRGIEHAQNPQLLLGGRRGGREGVRHGDLEARVGAHRVDGDAGVQGLEAHPPALGLEAEDAEGGDHARDAAEEQPALATAVAAVEPARARDEIHRLREAPLLVRGEDDDLATERDDVVGAAAVGQPDRGRFVAAPDGAGVQIAVTGELGVPDEAHVEKP